ncbi:hypothetical protein SSS_07617 [Sarcoptes scabiei]|uniref:Uncharacterized protein n=1 Tax=Sarcoptes scabiei TaxID=52283 RepID=A0A834R851_SARSC|nr:hypothetical protein SSS_07617 [Sarcoptes scabiei]
MGSTMGLGFSRKTRNMELLGLNREYFFAPQIDKDSALLQYSQFGKENAPPYSQFGIDTSSPSFQFGSDTAHSYHTFCEDTAPPYLQSGVDSASPPHSPFPAHGSGYGGHPADIFHQQLISSVRDHKMTSSSSSVDNTTISDRSRMTHIHPVRSQQSRSEVNSRSDAIESQIGERRKMQ